ncbi:MAG: sigma-70 family RNA polymerase sigma factor [Bacteroidales bacterium]
MSKNNKIVYKEDTELIKEALENDQTACFKLVEKYRDSVSAFIQGIIPQTQDVEDICQETFDKAFRNLSLYNSQWAFSTWLFTIAQNTALDHYRKMRTNLSPVNNVESLEGKTGAVDLAQSPEESLITHQTFDELMKAIKSLDIKYRKVAELRYIHEFAYEEIAKELNLPLNTVKTRINRAKKLLSNIWKS